MSRTVTLSASAKFGYGGKQFVARIRGRHSTFTFDYEFLGRKEGKRRESTSVEVDDSGLYIERDIDRKGNAEDSFWLVWRDGEDMRAEVVELADAMTLAKESDDHTINYDAIGRSRWISRLRTTQQENAALDPEELLTLRGDTANILGFDPLEKHKRSDVMVARQKLIDRLFGQDEDDAEEECENEAPRAETFALDLSSVSVEDLRAELARRGVG